MLRFWRFFGVLLWRHRPRAALTIRRNCLAFFLACLILALASCSAVVGVVQFLKSQERLLCDEVCLI
jgi:hypothetical protein